MQGKKVRSDRHDQIWSDEVRLDMVTKAERK